MSAAEIREAHKRLMKVHKGIRRVFSNLDETTLVGIYGVEYLGEVRKYGDGHTLWAVPDCIGELMCMLSDTELVLAVGKFPYLGKNSKFNPHVDLACIASWHDEIKSKERELREFPSQQFRFWAWQNDYPVHGQNASRAKVNKNRLLDCNQELDQLMQCQRDVSSRLLKACDEWLMAQDRKLKAYERWSPEKTLDPVIRRLLSR